MADDDKEGEDGDGVQEVRQQALLPIEEDKVVAQEHVVPEVPPPEGVEAVGPRTPARVRNNQRDGLFSVSFPAMPIIALQWVPRCIPMRAKPQ